jgi:hypothetical protein
MQWAVAQHPSCLPSSLVGGYSRLLTHAAACAPGPPKDGILDLAWHPKRNMLVSVSTTGRVSTQHGLHDDTTTKLSQGHA